MREVIRRRQLLATRYLFTQFVVAEILGLVLEHNDQMLFVTGMKQQVDQLRATSEELNASQINDTFKESVKTLASFSALSLKLMDPANRFIRLSGLIYDTKDTKRALDVSI